MKKYIYLIASFAALTFTACDPMEDVYEELDAINPDVYAPELAIELSTKDYELLKKTDGVPAYVTKDYYFASEEEAAVYIPQILNSKYPQFDNGTSVTASYNKLVYKVPAKVSSAEKSVAYEVTEEDYIATGNRYKNFDSKGKIVDFLKYKFTGELAPVERQVVVLSYMWYNGTANAVTSSFYFIEGEWRTNVYHVTADDYASVDNGFGSFKGSDEPMLPVYFDKFLQAKIVGPKLNDVQYVSYKFYIGRNDQPQRILAMIFNGSKWVPVEKNIVAAASLQFAKQDGKWKPDLTIRYSLVAADYQWIAANTALGNENNRANLKQYGNFFQGSTTSSNYWSPEAINVAIGALLKDKYPNSEEGQKYQVSYAAYKGGNITVTVTLILKNGAYVEFVK